MPRHGRLEKLWHGPDMEGLKSCGEVKLMTLKEERKMSENTNEKTTVTEETKTPESAGKTFTQDEVNAIVAERIARDREKQQEEAQKKIEEAQKLAEMNEAEKARYQLEELQKEVDAYKRRETINGLTKTARKMLSDDGINTSDELLSMLVTDDAETTKAAVESFSKLFSEAVEAEIKNRFKGAPPKAGSTSHLTKDQILAEPDRAKRQKLINENLKLFKGE